MYIVYMVIIVLLLVVMYVQERCSNKVRFYIMKDEILALRKLGFSIAEIVKETGCSVTEVCDVVYKQNNEDKSLTD